MSLSKTRAALISVFSNTTLILLKVVAGLLSGSVSVLSEAIHSSMDLAASLIAFFSVRVSSNPPDKDHPYGHGKFENLSGTIEAILLFIASGFIIWEAIHKLFDPQPLQWAGLAIAVMLFSAVVNIFVSKLLYRVAKREDSIALEADALHLKTDVYTSAGVAIGLSLVYFTGWYILDPLIALATAGLILYESCHLLKRALSPLLDFHLSEEEEALIINVLEQYRSSIYNYHELKTRRSGHQRYIEFHLELDPEISIHDYELISDRIELDLAAALENVVVTIHAETPQT